MARVFTSTAVNTLYDTPEIVQLRDRINAAESVRMDAERAFREQERRDAAAYEALLHAQRPAYPTPEHLVGLDTVAWLVHGDRPYGDHLGSATEADRETGVELPRSVSFSSQASRVNVYARAPYRVNAGTRVWAFTPTEVEAFAAALRERALKVIHEWDHEDGHAFVVASKLV